MIELLQALHQIQKSTRSLKANGSANGYKYLKGEKLLDHVRPLMDELGLLLVPEILSLHGERVDYKVGNPAREKTEYWTRLQMRFTWIHVGTGHSLACEWAASGQNGFDKGAGSAMTYGERYFLMKFFHISTDEDDVDALNREEAAPQLPELTPEHHKWDVVKKFIKEGGSTQVVLNKYTISKSNLELLCNT